MCSFKKKRQQRNLLLCTNYAKTEKNRGEKKTNTKRAKRSVEVQAEAEEIKIILFMFRKVFSLLMLSGLFHWSRLGNDEISVEFIYPRRREMRHSWNYVVRV